MVQQLENVELPPKGVYIKLVAEWSLADSPSGARVTRFFRATNLPLIPYIRHRLRTKIRAGKVREHFGRDGIGRQQMTFVFVRDELRAIRKRLRIGFAQLRLHIGVDDAGGE
jgi:hypothetical protein